MRLNEIIKQSELKDIIKQNKINNWYEINDDFLNILKKFVQKKLKTNNRKEQKIRIYFEIDQKNNLNFNLFYESDILGIVDYVNTKKFTIIEWFSDSFFAFYIETSFYKQLFDKTISKIEDLNYFSKWIELFNEYKHSGELKSKEPKINSFIINSINELNSKIKNQIRKPEVKYSLKNKYKIFDKLHRIERADNETFVDFFKEKYNDFLKNYKENKIEKILKNSQFLYYGDDKDMPKIISTFTFCYAHIHSYLAHFVYIAYNEKEARKRIKNNFKKYCKEYWNTTFVPDFIFNNSFFQIFNVIYYAIKEIIILIEMRKNYDNNADISDARNFKINKLVLGGIIIIYLTYVLFLLRCELDISL